MTSRLPSTAIVLRLSQIEGRALAQFLAHLRVESMRDFYPGELQELEDRLGEANMIARWLREDVLLEVSEPTAFWLVESHEAELEAGLASDGHFAELFRKIADQIKSSRRCDAHGLTLAASN